MSNNKMAEVAALLGVELGEPFDIKGRAYGPYTLTESGLCDCDGECSNAALMCLLRGTSKITKRPWMPVMGRKYYYIDSYGEMCCDHFVADSTDTGRLAMGNCFPTKEAAEAARSVIAAKYDEVCKDVRGYVQRDWGKGE